MELVFCAVSQCINPGSDWRRCFRAEQSLAALKKMLPVSTHVRRDMEKQAIDADQLVPGDAVLLEAGDQVPADGPRVV